jgi:hypothetical protein
MPPMPDKKVKEIAWQTSICGLCYR